MEKSDQKRTEISRSLRVKNRGSDDAIRRQFGSDSWGSKGRDFWGINSDTRLIKPYTGHFWQVVFDRRFSFFKTLGIGLGLTPRGGTEIRPENDEKITDLPLEERFLQRLRTSRAAPALTAKAPQSAIPHTRRFFCDKMEYLGTTGTVRNDCTIRCFGSQPPSRIGVWSSRRDDRRNDRDGLQKPCGLASGFVGDRAPHRTNIGGRAGTGLAAARSRCSSSRLAAISCCSRHSRAGMKKSRTFTGTENCAASASSSWRR